MKFYDGRFVAAFFLLSGFALALAASSAGAGGKSAKNKIKNHGSSCYTQLVSMLHNSSFPVLAKNLRYLTLNVETDEGDGIILQVRRPKREENNNKNTDADIDSDTVGWLLYQPLSYNLVSLSSFFNPERPDITTFIEKGDSLKFDRRYAYLFDMCRKKRNVELEARCATRHKDALKIKILSRDDNTPIKTKTSGAALYAAPDKACVMSEKAHVPLGAQVRVHNMSDDFYYIHYDDSKKGFITGWVPKEALPALSVALPEPMKSPMVQSLPASSPAIAPVQTEKMEITQHPEKIEEEIAPNEKTDKVRLPKYEPEVAAVAPTDFDVEEVPPPSNLVKPVDNKKPDRIRLPKSKPIYNDRM